MIVALFDIISVKVIVKDYLKILWQFWGILLWIAKYHSLRKSLPFSSKIWTIFEVWCYLFLSNWSLWGLSLSFSITADNLFPVASYYRDFLLTSKWRSRWVKWTRLHLPNGSIFFEYHIFVRLGLLESFSSNSILHYF